MGRPPERSQPRRAEIHAQWTGVPAAVAEHNVLSFLPYLQAPPTQIKANASVSRPTADGAVDGAAGESLEPTPSASAQSEQDPYGPRRWTSDLVRLSGKDRELNEFAVERVGEAVEQNLVMIHGYGAGLGFFYKNFEPLSRAVGWRVFALDLLGMGRSSRPAFRVGAKDRAGRVREAEDWFVDSLEEWRRARRLERFTLLGHSLGGYMAVAYALKYPGRLDKLILASPVGIPEDPYAVRADLPEPAASSLAAEFAQDQAADSTTPAAPPPRADNNNFLNARAKAEAAAAAATKSGTAADSGDDAPPAPRKPLPKWLTYLWDANISPFSLVRWSGPLGPRFVSGWTSRRFSHLPPAEAQALHTYAYTLFKLRGSGEYALAYVLAPGAFARSPLIRRIGGVGRQPLAPMGAEATTTATTTTTTEGVVDGPQESEGMRRETGLPVVFVYGENDWMDVAGGYAAKRKLDEARAAALQTASEAERRRERGHAKVLVVKNAGHHVYLDGWKDFNEAVLAEMRDVSAAATRDRPAADAASGS